MSVGRSALFFWLGLSTQPPPHLFCYITCRCWICQQNLRFLCTRKPGYRHSSIHLHWVARESFPQRKLSCRCFTFCAVWWVWNFAAITKVHERFCHFPWNVTGIKCRNEWTAAGHTISLQTYTVCTQTERTLVMTVKFTLFGWNHIVLCFVGRNK